MNEHDSLQSSIAQMLRSKLGDNYKDKWRKMWFEFHSYDGTRSFEGVEIETIDNQFNHIDDNSVFSDGIGNVLRDLYKRKPQTAEFRWNKGRFTLWANGTYEMEYLWDQADYDELMQFSSDNDQNAFTQLPANWQTIDKHLQQLYPDREPDETYGTLISFQLGGPDPLGRVNVFFNQQAQPPHYHYVTYGFSDAYTNEQNVTAAATGFGFELSFRLLPYADDFKNPIWPVGLLQWLAHYVFHTGNSFKEYDWIPLNEPLRKESDTVLTGLVFVADPTLNSQQAQTDSIQFLQVVGLTEREVLSIQEKRQHAVEIVSSLRRYNPLLITDMNRRD